MASIINSLREYLTGQSTVTDLLASTNSIRTDKEPQSTTQTTSRPFIVLQVVRSNIEHHLQGQIGLVGTIIEATIEGDTKVNCWAISEAIRQLFDGVFHSTMGTSSNQLTVRNVFVSDIRDNPPNMSGGREQGWPSVSMNLEVWHQQTVA